MTIWTVNGKQKVCKHYLPMFLREAYAFCLDSCIKKNEKCSFSTFCNPQPKNVLLMGNSPLHQCKCQIHENLFSKLEAMGLTYDSSWWESVLCNTLANSDCWKNECKICMDGKNFDPSKSLSAITPYKQWEDLEVPRNLKYQDIIFGTKYKGKDKFFSGLFIETLYKEHILPIETV